MFIVYPTNIDYLLDEVRLHIGDTESTLFSDSLVRSSLVFAVKSAYKRWGGRYLVFNDGMPTGGGDPIPAGYIYAKLPDGYGYVPSGLVENDIFRNPSFTFADTGATIITQEDEPIVVLMAAIILRRSYLSSSSNSFVNWSDGEYSYSNVASATTMRGLLADDLAALEYYFKTGRARPIRDNLPTMLV